MGTLFIYLFLSSQLSFWEHSNEGWRRLFIQGGAGRLSKSPVLAGLERGTEAPNKISEYSRELLRVVTPATSCATLITA